MTKSRIAVVFGALLVAAALVAAIQVAAPASDTYTVTADVTQAPNLFEGGRVMVRGVEVGLEPLTDLFAERCLFGGVAEIHAASSRPWVTRR